MLGLLGLRLWHMPEKNVRAGNRTLLYQFVPLKTGNTIPCYMHVRGKHIYCTAVKIQISQWSKDGNVSVAFMELLN